MVLLGGGDDRQVLGDLWAWDGNDWREVITSTPSARAEAAVAYDAARKRIVLFGGYRNEGDGRIRLGDTWEWNGRWARRTVHEPRQRVDNGH